MKIIKSTSDLEQIRNHHLHDTIKEIISPYIDDPDYRPQDDGYVGSTTLSGFDVSWFAFRHVIDCSLSFIFLSHT